VECLHFHASVCYLHEIIKLNADNEVTKSVAVVNSIWNSVDVTSSKAALPPNVLWGFMTASHSQYEQKISQWQYDRYNRKGTAKRSARTNEEKAITIRTIWSLCYASLHTLQTNDELNRVHASKFSYTQSSAKVHDTVPSDRAAPTLCASSSATKSGNQLHRALNARHFAELCFA